MDFLLWKEASKNIAETRAFGKKWEASSSGYIKTSILGSKKTLGTLLNRVGLHRFHSGLVPTACLCHTRRLPGRPYMPARCVEHHWSLHQQIDKYHEKYKCLTWDLCKILTTSLILQEWSFTQKRRLQLQIFGSNYDLLAPKITSLDP